MRGSRRWRAPWLTASSGACSSWATPSLRSWPEVPFAPWFPAAHGQNEVVIRAAAAATGRFVAGGFITVYDGVLGPWFLADFAGEAALDHLHYVILLPSVERCVDRVSNRLGHGFTDEDATRHMHREFAQADIDQRHVLADLPASAAETAAQMARRVQAGTLRYP